ncbi:TPA: hypothetical protein ACT2FU_001235 [Streptococcus suis]
MNIQEFIKENKRTLLHQRSILDCDCIEADGHHSEMDAILKTLFTLPDYSCRGSFTFEDDFHRDMNKPRQVEASLHTILDYLDAGDMKNGVDACLTEDGNLCFMTYGQSYIIRDTGEMDFIRSSLTVRATDREGQRIDFGKHFVIPKSLEVEPLKQDKALAL